MVYTIIIGILLSIVYSYIVLPINDKETPTIKPTMYPILYNGMIMLPYKKHALHIHHWCFFFILYIFQLVTEVPLWLYGFSFGLMIQGLMYSDCFEFIDKNPYLHNI